jgi:mannose-1-phosphate guanylyltransferase
MILPVIMAGGSGTRLWPLSRKGYPKQFLTLYGETTMLQQSVQRLEGLELSGLSLICNEQHRFVAAEQLRQIGAQGAEILLEPIGRNTAPAIAMAALRATRDGEDPLLLVLAADHVIEDVPAFHEAVWKAVALAEAGALVTFGILPTGPETGYGYIQRGEALDGGYRVDRFVEKPDSETAEGYLKSGDYYWNSGMFLFRASRYLEELERFRPDILAACRQAINHEAADRDFVRINEQAFRDCPSESIDYAVMEQTAQAAMVPLDAGWNDIGSWSALWDLDQKDDAGNSFKGDVMLEDTRDCLVHGESRLVATVGVHDLVIIETKDAVMVADRNATQDVKKIVERLEREGRSESQYHRVVYRPWGCFDSIEEAARFKVKRISVKPGAKLSVQMHHHRAEHWVVVSGTARVNRGDKSYLVTENESTYIHVGETHSLENPGKIPLELIEVQSGTYLGEDDIVRLKDEYGRD